MDSYLSCCSEECAGDTAGAGVGVDGAFTPVGACDVRGAMAFFAETITIDLCRCGNSPTSLRRWTGGDFLRGGAACFL